MKEQNNLSNQELSAQEKGKVRMMCCEVIAALGDYSVDHGLNGDHPVEKKILEVGYARDIELYRAKTNADLDKIVAIAQEAKNWLASLPDGNNS